METRLIVAYGLIAVIVLFFGTLGFIFARRRRARQLLWGERRR